MMKQLGLLLICLLMGCAVQPTASNTTQSGLAASGDTLIPSTTVALQSKAATIPITSTSADAIVQFEKGRELFENLRQGEALEHLRKAILLDTNFAQAHAYAGFLMTGAEALAELDKAEALSGTVPKAERLNILSMVADRRETIAESPSSRHNSSSFFQAIGALTGTRGCADAWRGRRSTGKRSPMPPDSTR